ncbi:cytochrome P450 71A9-like [Papaver somniferum]|uniref:cytochrome P450 71A9-like n=1 Tax=Papaver somniferum TaxID=3469 RepID=UPI000E6FB25B|nr:cytochrome P450 71A9-like [Papaver somniferum]
MILLLVFTTTLLLLILFVIIKNGETKGKWRLPPGPRTVPFLGNLHQLGNDLPHISFKKLSDKYGSIMFLKLGSVPTLVVSSADVAKEIFKVHDVVFSSRPVLYAPKKLTYGCSDIAFAPYGVYWREIRKTAILELLSAKRILSYRAVRKDEVALLIDSIRKSSSSSVPVNLSETFVCFMNNVVCQVAFGGVKYYLGESGDAGKTKFYVMLRELQNLFAGFSIADFFPLMGWIHKFNGLDARIKKSYRKLDAFFNKVIDEHINADKSSKPDVEDLVDALLFRSHKDDIQSATLVRDQIKGILMDIFVAGTDTSAVTLVWTMTELMRNPTAMKRAQEDVRTKVGTKDYVEESDLHKLGYVTLVIKEALRLHPPLPLLLPRETREDCTIKGYNIPKKTRVIINAAAISKDSKYWEDPEKFRPERFLDYNVDARGQNFEFIPFGGGRRGCPGMNFSIVLVELVLANLLHCFDWKMPPGMKGEEIDMQEAYGLTPHKKIPLCLVANGRQ